MGRGEPGEHRDRLREKDVEPETVGELDELLKRRFEGRHLGVVQTALGENLGPAGSPPLQVPVRRAIEGLTAERPADGAVDMVVSRRHVEQGSVEVKDERRRALSWQSAPPTRRGKTRAGENPVASRNRVTSMTISAADR